MLFNFSSAPYDWHAEKINFNLPISFPMGQFFLGPLGLPRSGQSPGEPRSKRVRRLSSAEEEIELGGTGTNASRPVDKNQPAPDVTYYGQSPASLSSQTSWHSDVEHGKDTSYNSFFCIIAAFRDDYTRTLSRFDKGMVNQLSPFTSLIGLFRPFLE